jgi:hypothetical protein
VKRLLGVTLSTLLCLGAVTRPAAAELPLNEVREAWLPGVEEIVAWHREKQRLGPQLTGSEGWRHFLDFLEREFRATGVLELERNRWTFERWRTSEWPDDSGWSLTINGQPVPVANAGANSGATGPQGLTAPLVLLDADTPAAAVDGRIAVLPLQADPAVVEGLASMDYEFREADAAYPWDEGALPASRPDSVSWQLFPQLLQSRAMIARARKAGASGALLLFDAGEELLAGHYTFPVPDHYSMPTLILDRVAGETVLAAAGGGGIATLRLEAEREESTAWQLVGFLPGRNYGTERDEWIQLVTHTDGPSVSQDNGALGLLALTRYFARLPRVERPRSLLLYLDCRHYMPGQEEVHAAADWFTRNPGARERVVAAIGMEHLGQIEYEERGEQLVPSGRVDPSLIWVTDDDALLKLAVGAVKAAGLPGATVRNVARPGREGRSQGTWYGMAAPRRVGHKPAAAIMGTMGGYWSLSSGLDRLDPELFRRQVASFVPIVADFLVRDFNGHGAPLTGSPE